MGTFFSKHQTQYDTCDICKSNSIKLTSAFLIKKTDYQGSLYFTCENGHNFYTNSKGYSHEELKELEKRFNC